MLFLEQWEKMIFLFHIIYINVLKYQIVILIKIKIGSIIVKIVNKDIIGYGLMIKKLLIIHNVFNQIMIFIVVL